MRRLMLAFLIVATVSANGSEVVRAGIWEFHDSFWMSLHQTLIDEAMRKTPRELTGWTDAERSAWNDAVAAYRKAGGGAGDLTFAQPMQITSDALTQVSDDAIDPLIDSPLADTLKHAAAAYRAHWWATDEKGNRFFIGYASAMARDEGAELVSQHEKVYRTPWPKHISVYVTPSAGPFGAFTFYGLAGGWITTMSWSDEGYQGLRALEMLLHESSHAVVNPNRGTVATAINDTSKRLGIRPPHDLWHAILFATSSELTRRVLVARGATTFVPSSVDLFNRAWPMYRDAVQSFWMPYLEGRGTLEEAIGKTVEALAARSSARAH